MQDDFDFKAQSPLMMAREQEDIHPFRAVFTKLVSVTRERDALRAENERLRISMDAMQGANDALLAAGEDHDDFEAMVARIILDRDALRQRVAALEEGILAEIMGEVSRAVRKFPTWPTDPLHAVAVIGEEFGELTKAALGLTYEPHKTSADEVRKEAVQTAAMALRFVLSLDRYEYKPGEQHGQDIRAIMAATQ